MKLFASLREGRFEMQPFTLPDGANVGDALARSGVPPTAIAVLFLNGRHAQTDSLLAEGDTLSVFPPVGGG
jgi:molybdopterin converting factor small subunit